MGISLGDLGSFAVGAIEQDKKNTAEKLVDRRAELEADRQMHINMKEQKYARDLKKFDEENKKFKSVESVNAEFKGMGEISPAKYGERYLSETNPTLLYQYKTLYKDNPNQLNEWLAGYGNDAIKNYKTTNTEESLNISRKEAIDTIEAEYKTKLENARGDSFLIGKIIGDKNDAIASVGNAELNGEKGIEVAKEINTEVKEVDNLGFTFGELKPVKMGVPEKWKKDSNIQVLRKDLKKDISNINKKSVDTTLRVMSDLNIPLPKQLFVYEQGLTKGAVVGFKKSGKTVNNHLVRLDNQAIDFLTNEYVYGKETDASNVSTYFSAVETENAVTTRLRDYSSEKSTSQTKGFWKDRQNVVAFVPFSVVGLDNDFRYNEDGSGQILDISDRKTVGAVYYNTLKKIATANDPEFKNATEADSINKLQDRLLKLKPGEENNLLTQVKTEMATTLGLNETKTEGVDKTTNNIVVESGENRVIYNGKSIIVNEESIKLFKDGGVDITALPKDNVTNKKVETTNKTIIDNKTDSGSVAEQVEKATTKVIKIKPVDVGSDNQSGYFETLDSILDILPNEMSGQEIMDKYNIAFPINKFTKYSPSN